MTDRVATLARELFQARILYHRNGSSPISNGEYDKKKTELRSLSPQHPEVLAVGAPPSDSSPLLKVAHSIFMGSVFNAKDYSPKDDYLDGFNIWHGKMKGAPLYGELKGDGTSLRLTYKDGVLIQAATRGDGKVGEDVTHNVRLFKNVPIYTQYPFTGEVRGEGILFNEDWKALGEAGGKNPRNTASGAIGRKTGGESVATRMRFYGFDVIDLENRYTLTTKQEKVDLLNHLGFEQFLGKMCDTTADAVLFHQQIAEQRQNLSHEIDGIVFYVNSLEVQADLGVDSNSCWRSQVAFKFPAVEAIGTLQDVVIQVGHTGSMNPVAILQPTEVGGVTVRRASLANYDDIAKLGIAIGDRVIISRGGDVIPDVIGLAEKGANRKEINPPEKCPVCAGHVQRRKVLKGKGAIFECTNDDCEAKTSGKVRKWARDIDVIGLGPGVIEAMFAADLIQTVADLYRLDIETLSKMPFGKTDEGTFGISRATAIVNAINLRREITLPMFLGALGVRGLGAGVVENVQEKMPGEFDKLDDWLGTKLIDFASQIGMPNTAMDITSRITRVRAIIDDLLLVGVKIVKPEPKPVGVGPLAGKTFCLTGAMSRGRKDIAADIIAAGGSVADDVKAGVTLVQADPTSESSKSKKAKKVGSEVISEEALMALVNGACAV